METDNWRLAIFRWAGRKVYDDDDDDDDGGGGGLGAGGGGGSGCGGGLGSGGWVVVINIQVKHSTDRWQLFIVLVAVGNTAAC